MDDWVILAPTRWKLRHAVRQIHQIMAELKLNLHPDKTFIGRVERGFDFLGYRFGPRTLGLARPTVPRLAEHVTRLYEQDAALERIGDYVRQLATVGERRVGPARLGARRGEADSGGAFSASGP